LDLESAAALDRLDVLQSFFDERGARRPETDPKVVESGFLYACGYGSLDAAKYLLDRGVDPGARDEQGQTALHWAAWSPQPEIIKLLLERGAPVDAKDRRFHATPLDTALWTWNNSPKEEYQRCYEAVSLLARAGAKLDRDHWRGPGNDRSAMLEKIDSDLRMLAALRGEMP
jgi:ankyrin repeat protein